MNHPAPVHTPTRQPGRLNVAFLLLPDFTLSAFAGFVDTLRLSNQEWEARDKKAICTWTIEGVDQRPVKASCGTRIMPESPLTDPARFDCIVVVGGLLAGYAKMDPKIPDYLRRADREGCLLVGVCTGSFCLAEAGLMKGRKTCVDYYHLRDFENRFPDLEVEADTIFHADGQYITGLGGATTPDIAAYIVEKYCGRSAARRGISGMMLESSRGLGHPQPHIEAGWFSGLSNITLRRAILHMDQNIGRSMTVRNIARHIGVSTSTLDKLFRQDTGLSAALFCRLLRLAHGHWEVMNTPKPITRIAAEYDFSNTSHFIKLHQDYYGCTPTQARRKAPDTIRKIQAGIQPSLPHIAQEMLAGKLFLIFGT